jgi:GNAT superfamily N-acetyltransferase
VILDNLARAWTLHTLLSQGTWEEFPGLHRFHTEHQKLERNGVLQGSIPAGEFEHRISESIALVLASGRPYTWQYDKLRAPPGFADRLNQAGIIELLDQKGMSRDLLDESKPPAAQGSCTTGWVQTRAEVEAWAGIVASAFAMTPQLDRDSLDRERLHIAGRGETCLRLLGHNGTQPVCALQILGHADTAGIYSVATLRSARKKGYASSLIRTALRELRLLGFRRAVLIAAPAGASLYHRLGFRDQLTLGVHIWRP